MRLQGLITRSRRRLRQITRNAARFINRTADIGIRPVADPTWPASEPGICRPILARTGAVTG